MLDFLFLGLRTLFGTIFWIVLSGYLYSILTRDRKVKVSLNTVGWPLLGTYLRFQSNIHEKLANQRKKRGEIFSAYLGSEKVVVLNSEKTITEAFSNLNIYDSNDQGSSSFGQKSVFFTHGLDISPQSKGRLLYNFDLEQLEGKIQLEMRHFLNLVEGYHGCQLDLDKLIDRSTANIMSLLVMGKMFQYGDPKLLTFIALLNEISNNTKRSDLNLILPGMISSTPSKNQSDSHSFRKAMEICNSMIQEHRQSFNDVVIRDFIDCNIKEMRHIGSNSMTDDDLALASLDLIVAGTDAVSTCIMWCLYTIATYPDVKEKLLKEVDGLHPHKTPSFSDIKLMPYVQAFIHEIMRWKTIVPISSLKSASSDTTVCEHYIPQGTNVLANFWAVNHDPEVWDDPKTFKPERFLKDQDLLTKASSVSFSHGPRKCPGETIIHKEVFLYIVSLLQMFDIRFLPGVKPDIKKEVIISNRPKNFEICMPPRFEYKKEFTSNTT